MLSRGLFNWFDCAPPSKPILVKFYPGKGYYEGEFSGQQRDGLGVMIWLDGSIYQGEWKNDMHHGRGRIIHPDGDIYDGEWKQGKANGQGA